MAQADSIYLGKGVYTVAEAAKLTGADYGTIRRWLLGYSYKHKGKVVDRPPIFTAEFGDVDGQFIISFQDLIELLFVTRFRAKKVPWGIIHEAFELARKRFDSNHPFSAINFKTDGRRIFEETVHKGRKELSDLHLNQRVIPEFIEPSLTKALEFEKGKATIWYPEYPSKLVVIDPQRSFGRPIVARSGIPTEVLQAAFAADEDVRQVAAEYHSTPNEVRAAVKFQARLAA